MNHHNQHHHHPLHAKRSQDAAAIPRHPEIRALVLLLDASDAMALDDFKPSRWALLCRLLKAHIGIFFDTNPLSQLCIVATFNGIAKVISHFGNSPEKHIENIYKIKDTEGDPSLQNGLKLCLSCLELCPAYCHKEVLTIYAALNTCDPGNIFQVQKRYETDQIACSCISLSVMVNLNKEIAEATGGAQHTILNQQHFDQLLHDFMMRPTQPRKGHAASLIRMGFPTYETNEYSFCSCHGQLKVGGYTCPRCGSKECGLPAVCKVCKLLLASSAHLAKTQSVSFLKVFPTFWEAIFLSTWREGESVTQFSKDQMKRMGKIIESNGGASLECKGCGEAIQLKQDPESLNSVSVCHACSSLFCLDCDIYLHSSQLACPGCFTL